LGEEGKTSPAVDIALFGPDIQFRAISMVTARLTLPVPVVPAGCPRELSRIYSRSNGVSEAYKPERMVHSLPPAVQAITENPVSSRDDLVKLLKDLLVPLHNAQSSGGSRIRLGNTGTHFDNVAAEMEGFARALWGLTPLLAHDANAAGFEDLRDAWVKGLANGADPEQVDEYWGDCTARDQRFVEMAALVSVLRCADHKASLTPPGLLLGARTESLLGAIE
jgi:hypothetical protein